LVRSLAIGGLIALVLILLQGLIARGAFCWIEADAEVEQYALSYFRILIWGAPAVLGLYSFNGWFLGRQNARFPMTIAIVQNVVNIGVSLCLVMGLGMKVEGVAIGTLVFNEPLTSRLLTGITMILVAVVIIIVSNARKTTT
jgi:MATE family multidrug resistance protein